MATIKKNDFAKDINRRLGLPTSRAADIVDVIFQEIIGSLQRGEAVKITNFGTFEVRSKRARAGRNPRTGEPAIISARRVPTFRASTSFRDRVKNS